MDCKCLLAQMNIHDVGCKNYILSCGMAAIEGGTLDSGGINGASSSASDYTSLGFILPNSPYHGPGLLETIPGLDSTAASVNGESEEHRDVLIKPRDSTRACGVLLDTVLATSSSPSTILNTTDLAASPRMIAGMELPSSTASSFNDNRSSATTSEGMNLSFDAHTINLFPTAEAAPTPALSISNRHVLRAKVVQQVGREGGGGTSTSAGRSSMNGTKRRRVTSENAVANSSSNYFMSGVGGNSSMSTSRSAGPVSSSTISVTAGGVSKTFGCPIVGCEEKYSRLSNMKAHVILSCRRVSTNILVLRKALKKMKLRPASVAGLKRGVDQIFLQNHREGIMELDSLIPDSIKVKKQRIRKDAVSGSSNATAAVVAPKTTDQLQQHSRVERTHRALAAGFIREHPFDDGQKDRGQAVAAAAAAAAAASSFSNAAIHI